MAVVDRYTSAYLDPTVQPVVMIPGEVRSGKQKRRVSTVEVTNGDSIGSKQYWGYFPSSARLEPDSKFYFDAITGVADFDFGDVTTPDALVNGADIHLAGSAGAMSAVDIANYHKPLWQLLGMASDPGGEILLYSTLKAAATATGTLTLVLKWSEP